MNKESSLNGLLVLFSKDKDHQLATNDLQSLPVDWTILFVEDMMSTEDSHKYGYYDQDFLRQSRCIFNTIRKQRPDICCLIAPLELAFVTCQGLRTGLLRDLLPLHVLPVKNSAVCEYFPEKAMASYCADFVMQSGITIAQTEMELRSSLESTISQGVNEGKPIASVNEREPLVSVLIPHYNGGTEFSKQLESLANQEYSNFEVIVVDDGSTDKASIQQWNRLKKRFKKPVFEFKRRIQNLGISATRNEAVQLSRGEWLIFCDADNISRPNMIADLVNAAVYSAADIVTSYCLHFEEADHKEKKILEAYAPLGPCIELGWNYNVFGDVNGIFKRQAFEKAGGFSTPPNVSYEDWILFAKLALSGFKLEVIPEILYEYRVHSDSFMRSSVSEDANLIIHKTYAEALANGGSRAQKFWDLCLQSLQEIAFWRETAGKFFREVQETGRIHAEQQEWVSSQASELDQMAGKLAESEKQREAAEKKAEDFFHETQQMGRIYTEQQEWVSGQASELDQMAGKLAESEKQREAAEKKAEDFFHETQQIGSIYAEQQKWVSSQASELDQMAGKLAESEKQREAAEKKAEDFFHETQKMGRIYTEQQEWVSHQASELDQMAEKLAESEKQREAAEKKAEDFFHETQKMGRIYAEQQEWVSSQAAEIESLTKDMQTISRELDHSLDQIKLYKREIGKISEDRNYYKSLWNQNFWRRLWKKDPSDTKRA